MFCRGFQVQQQRQGSTIYRDYRQLLSLSAPIGTKTESKYTDNPSMVDLVLTNEVVKVLDIECHAPLNKSDHCIVTFKYHCYLDYSQPKERS